jgi:oligopeptide transport system substrate-binding protein
MKIKKILAIVMAATLFITIFAACAKKEETPKTVAKIDWTAYDSLITQIKSSTDFVAREKLMHQAEDMLMKTGGVCPLYYYNDVYMMKPGMKGFYATETGYKFFMYTTLGTATKLRINLASEPAKLDPALNSSVDGAILAANSFAGLFTYDSTGKAIPALAKSYTVSADGMTYTFTMKDGLKWSDGSALNAKDLEYSWKRAASTETAADYSYMFNGIKGYGTDANIDVKASADGKTFTVVLTAPCAYFLDLCASRPSLPSSKARLKAQRATKTRRAKLSIRAHGRPKPALYPAARIRFKAGNTTRAWFM